MATQEDVEQREGVVFQSLRDAVEALPNVARDGARGNGKGDRERHGQNGGQRGDDQTNIHGGLDTGEIRKVPRVMGSALPLNVPIVQRPMTWPFQGQNTGFESR
jgi:hypothetical protein